MTLTVGSLFSGIEGIGLGLERAGMSVAWRCEADPKCRALLAAKWRGVPVYDDVRTIHGATNGRHAGPVAGCCARRVSAVDVLCGGFPCQDLSVAGGRAGLAGERSGLFHEFMRLASEIAPRWVVVENVPGLLSSNGGRDMGVVLGVLADLGYGWCYRVLDARYFGVAQRRRRVFVVGCLGDPARAAQVLLEPESCDGNPAPSRAVGSGVAALTANGVGTCGADDNQGQAGHLIADTLRSHPRARSNTTGALAVTALTSRCGDTLDDQQVGQLVPIAFNWQASHTARAPNCGPLAGTLEAGKIEAVAYNPYRTLEKDGSITSGFGERPVVDALHGPTGNKEPLVAADMVVRRLTPLECERLQGFPDHWTAGFADSTRYRMLGNAVCVPVAAWIGRRIMAAAA